MIRVSILALALAVPAGASAEPHEPTSTYYFEVVAALPRPVLTLSKGGCLLGPLAVYGPDGREILTLGDGVDLPSGCSSAKR